MSEFFNTSTIIAILTAMLSIILLLLAVYYITKKNKISTNLITSALPFIGSSTGAYTQFLPIDVTDPIYDIFGQPIIITPQIQLDLDSHIFAMSSLCKEKGYGYDFVDNSCTHTKNTCISPISGAYLEWHDPYCLSTVPLWKDMCGTYGFEYNKGKIDCDYETKICGPKIEEGSPVNLPTCVIDSSYCSNKGVSYDSSDGLGDCYTNDPQAISQMVLGTTITNLYKKNIEETTTACGGPAKMALLSGAILANPTTAPVVILSSMAISPECAKKMTLLLLTPFTALGYSVKDPITFTQTFIQLSSALTLFLPQMAIMGIKYIGSYLPRDPPGSAGTRPGGIF